MRDTVGHSRETMTLPPHVSTVADLSRFLVGVHPALSGRLAQVRFAVNESFAEPDTALSDGDVVALIPPVCGG